MAPQPSRDNDAFAPFVPRLLQSWPKGLRYQEREGSMLFMDISGFTVLSERLAKQGRIGAEQVAEALNRTFTELLGLAVDLGSDPLKFGGDATLQFFEGANHTARAARAAALMRSRLRTVGKVDTPDGALQLRMSQGIHTGVFDFFKVACSHQELIVTGAGASTTVAMEGTANAGEILLSGAAAARLASSLIGKSKGDGMLLKRAPAAPRRVPSFQARSDYRLEQFTPVALRPHLVGKSDGEHRRATIAFLKIKGTDDRIAAEGLDEVAGWLQKIMVTVLTAAEEGGVTFLSTDIDENSVKIILSAGTPVATGNDDDRMLHALRAVANSDIGHFLQIGVNRGTLFAGDLGAPFRRYYTVIGDGVNLAARVMANAKAGQVLATPIVLERSRTIFDVAEQEPFVAKGKTEPVRTHAVGDPIGTREEAAGRDLELIGREEELGELIGEFRKSRSAGRALEIRGAPGVGKSRLLGEARAKTDSTAWIKVSCEEYERITPYAPIGRLLRRLLGLDLRSPETVDRLTDVVRDVAPELESWIPLLAIPFDVPVEDTPETASLDDRFKKDRTHEAVVELLGALRPGHAAFVFDNAQWMDDVSGELVAKLLERIELHRWLVVLVRRPGTGSMSLPDDAGPQLVLTELGQEELLRLATLATRLQPLPRPHVEEVVRRSGGNPLFLLEMLDATHAGGSIDEMPGSIEELVTARIDRLEPRLRRLLRYSSALGRTVDVDLLIESLGDDMGEASDESNWSALADFLEPAGDGKWRFRQNIFRDVAYQSLPFNVRISLHHRIGSVMESGSADPDRDADLLSLHFSLAKNHARSWHYSVMAGDRARTRNAIAEAADFYGRSVASGRRLESIDQTALASVYESLGDVNELAGLFDAADEAFKASRRAMTSDSVATARLMSKQGMLREKSGELTQALRWFGRGLRLLGDAPDAVPMRIESAEVFADLQIAYAGVRFRQGRFQDCVLWCNEALAGLASGEGRAQQAHALHLLVTALAHLRRPIENLGDRALAIYSDLGDQVGLGNILTNLGVEAFYRGDWDAALDLYTRSEEARRTAGDVIAAAASMNNAAEIYSDQGRVLKAIDMFRDALAVFEGARFPVGIALVHLNLGKADTRAGEADLAEERLASALQDFQDMGAASYVLDTKITHAEADLLAGDPTRAEELATELLTGMTVDEYTLVPATRLRRVRGYCRAGVGNLEGALTDLEESLRLATEADAAFETALTLEALLRFFADDPRAPGWQRDENNYFRRLGVIATPVVPVAGTSDGVPFEPATSSMIAALRTVNP